MSSPPEKEKDKEKDVKENPSKESADPEPPKVKIEERIENTIKEQYRQASEKYKMGLENIKGKLEKSEKIINSEEIKIIDKKERYINQYNEAELNWVKSGALRFYNKGKPPVNCATSLVLDKE